MSSLLSTAAVFFPLWFSIWIQAPVSSEQLSCQGKAQISPSQLEMLSRYYADQSAGLRMKLAQQLAAAPVPAGQELFLRSLRSEKDGTVQAGLIRLLPKIGLAETDMEPWLSSGPASVRLEALRIYARQKHVTLEKLRPSLKEQAPAIRKLAWSILAERTAVPLPEWEVFAPLQTEKDVALQALALRAACRLQPRPAQVVQWLDQAAGDAPVLRMAAAADPFPEKPERLKKLASDPLPAVRIQLCRARHSRFREALSRLLRDRDAAVRSAMCRRLGDEDSLSVSEFQQLLFCLNDGSLIVREAAEQAVQRQVHGRRKVFIPLLHDQLDGGSNDSNTLAGLFRIAAKEKLSSEREPAAAVLTDGEAAPEVLAAALKVLTAVAPENYAADRVLLLAGHRSPMVRVAVAEACGVLKLRGSVPVLKALAGQEQPAPVREAAFLAMGRNPESAFASDLLRCLKQVTSTTEQERTNAAWAAGHLKKDSVSAQTHRALAARLAVQCTVPVIPGLVPSLDSPSVLANAMISVAVMKKKHGEAYGPFFEKIRAVYDVMPGTKSKPGTGMADMMPNPELNADLIGQLKKYLAGEKPVPSEIPGYFLEFSLRPADSDGGR